MTYITVLPLIFLIGCLWYTRDCIRVYETFHDSWFKKFEGNKYIDPEYSWVNKGDPWTLYYFVVVSFSDLLHLLGTLILSCFFLAIYFTSTISISLIVFIGLCFGSFGAGVWLFYQIWRKILNK